MLPCKQALEHLLNPDLLHSVFSIALSFLLKKREKNTIVCLLPFCFSFFQAWCAAGNCFSLQREHDIAIKFFQRAIQVDPNYAYAYTLLGHEFVLTEELEKALACFRNAIRMNPRHYNAW